MSTDARHDKLVEHALALLVQIEGASPQAAAEARTALQSWRAACAEHDAAALEAQGHWDMLFALSPNLRQHFDKPDGAEGHAHARLRRQTLLALLATSGTGLLAALGYRWHEGQPMLHARYETRTAELRELTLSDETPGSTLTLAPRTALEVTLYRHQRTVALLYGEAHFRVAANAARPFQVRTGSALVEVVGTRFTVRNRGAAIHVGVEEGHVRVSVRNTGAQDGQGSAHDLHGGEALSIADGVPGRPQRLDTASMAAWRDGWLVFDNTPLPEALATINAYRTVPIRMAGAGLDPLRLSGRFRADDIQGLVESLPMTLPVRLLRTADGSLSLVPDISR